MIIWFVLAALFCVSLGVLYTAKPEIGHHIMYGGWHRLLSARRRPATAFQLGFIRVVGVCLIIVGLLLLTLPLLDFLEKMI